MKGKTGTGFKFDIDEAIRDDMELLENLCALDKGDLQVLPDVVEGILGKEQKKQLYEHCRTEKGRVSSTKVMAEIKGIFDSINESGDENLKN